MSKLKIGKKLKNIHNDIDFEVISKEEFLQNQPHIKSVEEELTLLKEFMIDGTFSFYAMTDREMKLCFGENIFEGAENV